MDSKCSPLTRVNVINEISSLLNDSSKILKEITKSLGWDEDLLTSQVWLDYSFNSKSI